MPGPELPHDEALQAPDDPAAQEEVEKGSAELEAVRKAEEKAGLVGQPPGKGPRDGLALGLDPLDPLARDLADAIGSSVDGAPLADPTETVAGVMRLPELAGISEDELRAKYDIPVQLNDAVVAYIRFFQTDARKAFTTWLARSGKFLPMMRPILEKEGVPLDTVYLSMIESGFNAYAYSPAKAAGLWQFMVGTSRRYGLVTDFWVDERRDPVKATQAAAKYLRDLRERYHGDWYLAWAGYNAGEGKVDRAIRQESTRDFWRMMSNGRTLRAETKHYVPKLIAAALIAKHPERFGFQVPTDDKFDGDLVQLADAVDLRVVAKLAGITLEDVRLLNPELRRYATPPDGWTIRLPKGSKDAFLAEYAKLPPEGRLAFTDHKVEKGEPLAQIARAYGVSEGAILRTNGLRSARQVKVGRVLVIPMSQSSHGLAQGDALAKYDPPARHGKGARSSVAASGVASAMSRARPGHALPADAVRYRVQPGDSLWTIAAKFSTTVDQLKRLNGISGRKARGLQAGQTLAVRRGA